MCSPAGSAVARRSHRSGLAGARWSGGGAYWHGSSKTRRGMIRRYSSSRAHERDNVRRKRFQEGSLQVRSHGNRKMWVVLYWEKGVRKYHTLGFYSELTKSSAQEKQTEFMKDVNGRVAALPEKEMTFGDFLDHVALP